IHEAIQGMPIIQAFRQEKRAKEEFHVLNHRHVPYERKLVTLSAPTSFNLVSFFRNLTFVAFIWYFGSFSLQAESVISIGMLYAFIDYITRVFEPVNDIVNQLPLVEQARVAGNRVFAVMDYEGENIDHSPLPRYAGDVLFDGVSFAYDGTNDVLRNITFFVKQGDTVVFFGHTGSGKSTTMHLLIRFYDHRRVDIYITGYPIKISTRL